MYICIVGSYSNRMASLLIEVVFVEIAKKYIDK